MTWLVTPTDEGVHVTPEEDLRDHPFSMTCWCRPTRDDNVLVHHSMDRREEFERGERVVS